MRRHALAELSVNGRGGGGVRAEADALVGVAKADKGQKQQVDITCCSSARSPIASCSPCTPCRLQSFSPW